MRFLICGWVTQLLGSVVVSGAELPKPKVTSLGLDAPKQILFIGNSYLYYGDSLHNHVRRMARMDDPEDQRSYKYKSATISGAALIHHDIWSYLKSGQLGLEDPFDIVVLQGGSGAVRSDERREKFRKTVGEFDKLIRETGAKTALYMTHAYVEPHARVRPDMIDDLVTLYVNTANEIGALVIPVGLAFAEAYRRRPNMKLHTEDGTHPSLIGTYLAACVVYASLYDRYCSGSPYDYRGRIARATAAFLQKVADDTVRKFQRRTR